MGNEVRRYLLAVAGAVLLGGAVLPSQASAACGVPRPLVGWQLSVGLSHGYCLTLTPADASPFGGGTLLIAQVTKGSLETGLTRVGYRIHSSAFGDQWKSLRLARTDNWMSVSLGRRGQITATFHARRRIAIPPAGGCTGQDGSELLGVWKGQIRFTGEHRYATVHTTSTPGTVVLKEPKPSDPSCGQTTTAGPTDIPGPYFAPTLTLDVPNAGGVSSFDASLAQGLPTVEFRAYAGSCSFQRLAPASDITVSNDLDWNAQTPPSSATLTPPSPFRGTGTYSGGALTGTLSAYCPSEQRYVSLSSPAPASWSFF